MRSSTSPSAKRRSLHFRRRALPRCSRAASGRRAAAAIFVLDHVIGKHLYIDYAVSIDGGRVHRVDILQYRESYGGEVRSPSWLAQFVGKTSASPLQVGSDIRNISGATLSSHARDRRREENFGRLWTPPIAFAARSRCLALSSRSLPPVRLAATWKKRSTRPSRAVAEVHRLMSFHDPQSDVSRLNREAFAARRRRRMPGLIRCWKRRSSSIADPPAYSTSRSLLCCSSAGLLPRGAERSRAGCGPDRCRGRGRIARTIAGSATGIPAIRIDLGGIAKGFAVDRALDVLRGRGLVRGLVNAGGDLAAFGPEPELVHHSPSPRMPAASICRVAICECGAGVKRPDLRSAAIRRCGRLRGH